MDPSSGRHRRNPALHRWATAARVLVVGLCLIQAHCACSQPQVDECSFAEIITNAGEAFRERFIMEKMVEAIASYKAVLPGLDSLSVLSQAFALNRLSQLCYELTTFSDGYPPEDRELLQVGKAYGYRSLRLNPGFAALEKNSFTKAIDSVIDPAALLWTAHCWGAYLAFDPLQGIVCVNKIKAMYERCLAVEEGYWAASAHSALGALLVVTPEVLGGNPEGGQTHLEKAIALDPDYLENRVVYAQYWGFTYDFFGNVNGIRDAKLIERELNLVLEAPIGDWPFWNREAKKEVQILLERLREFSP